MGQRSQIYVRYNGKLVIANYYQWNYGERMISRARYGIEHLQYIFDNDYHWIWDSPYELEKYRRIFDVNFDMKDMVISNNILKELENELANAESHGLNLVDQDSFVFGQDNNDGQLFIDILDADGVKTMKYVFYDVYDDVLMSASEYMSWNLDYEHDKKDWKTKLTKDTHGKDVDDIIAYTAENIAEIEKLPRMTDAELYDFLTNTIFV